MLCTGPDLCKSTVGNCLGRQIFRAALVSFSVIYGFSIVFCYQISLANCFFAKKISTIFCFSYQNIDFYLFLLPKYRPTFVFYQNIDFLLFLLSKCRFSIDFLPKYRNFFVFSLTSISIVFST